MAPAAAILPVLPEVAVSLALAVVGSSAAPLLLLDGACHVIAASTTFCDAFAVEPSTIVGLSVYALGDGEWNLPRLRSLLTGVASGAADVPAYEIDLTLPGLGKRRLVLNAHKLEYADSALVSEGVRILLAVADVTDARAAEQVKDDLLREKAVLMQEIQHRVANSLQIIASVLMQSARKVGSEETRGHLRDAHRRVMSISALQKQLAASDIGDVDLGAYLGQLCQSLAASMIDDHGQLTLQATSDGSMVGANVSVSIGLVVTELVINALKHAFPDHRKGTIRVDYRADGPDWVLKVSDDGVGMAASGGRAGLGTSIVTALARHLRAEVGVADTGPGTTVSLVHVEPASGDIFIDADDVAV